MPRIDQNLTSYSRTEQVSHSEPLVYLFPVQKSTGGVGPTPTEIYSSLVNETTVEELWEEYDVVKLNNDVEVTVNNPVGQTVAVLDGDTLKYGNAGIFSVTGTYKHTKTTVPGFMNKDFNVARYEFTGFKEGTTEKLLWDNVRALADPTKEQQLFLTYGGRTDVNDFDTFQLNDTFELNPNCWAYSLDFSAVPVGTSSNNGASYYSANSGVLITPRHVLGARHWRNYEVGFKFQFLEPNGTVHVRTVIGMAPGGTNTGTGDMMVCTLDSAVPATIKPMPIVSDTWFVKGFGDIQYGTSWWSAYIGGLAVRLERHKLVGVCFLGGGGRTYSTQSASGTINGNNFSNKHGNFFVQELTAESIAGSVYDLLPLDNDVNVGDSGAPIMVIVDDALALLGTYTSYTIAPLAGALDGWHLKQQIIQSDTAAGDMTGETVTMVSDPLAPDVSGPVSMEFSFDDGTGGNSSHHVLVKDTETDDILNTITLGPGIETHTFQGLYYNKQYTTEVYAVGPPVSSTLSVTLWSDPPPTSTPTNVAAATSGDTTIDLTWDLPVDLPKTGFKVEQSLDGSTNWTQLAILANTTTSYQATGLIPSTEYHFRITPCNENPAPHPDQVGIPSAVVNDTTDTPAQVFLINENMEGTGLPANFVVNTGNPDFDYTADPISGTKSLFCPGRTDLADNRVDINYLEQTGNVYIYLQTKIVAGGDSLGTGGILSCFKGGSGVFHLTMKIGRKLHVQSIGAPSTLATTPLVEGNVYHVWIDVIKGVGSNLSTRVYWSEDGIKPTSGNVIASENGTASTSGTKLRLYGDYGNANTSHDMMYDNILISPAPIGDNPV